MNSGSGHMPSTTIVVGLVAFRKPRRAITRGSRAMNTIALTTRPAGRRWSRSWHFVTPAIILYITGGSSAYTTRGKSRRRKSAPFFIMGSPS